MSDKTPPKDVLKDPRMRRKWVGYQMGIRGSSMAQVARDAGVKPETLYQVFERPYPRMEEVISTALGLKASELFPERYLEDGSYFRGKGAAA